MQVARPRPRYSSGRDALAMSHALAGSAVVQDARDLANDDWNKELVKGMNVLFLNDDYRFSDGQHRLKGIQHAHDDHGKDVSITVDISIVHSPAVKISEANRRRVEMATVRLPEKGGCGVLVGEFILTATHCIDWSGTGGMALGDVYANAIRTASGAKFRLGVAACEPVSDIAALITTARSQI